jgi:DNA-binding CsgD family transcriptional regulator
MGFHQLTQTKSLSSNALDFIHCLAPHVSRALHIHNQISALKHHSQSLVNSLKRTNLGVLLLDEDFRVVFATPEANHIIELNPAIRIGRFGQVEIYDAQQQVDFHARLTALLNPVEGSNQVFALPLHHPEKLHPLKLNAVTLTDNNPFTQSAIRIGIFLNDPERPRLIPHEYLQQAYTFTRAEVQVAQLLLNGACAADIAAARTTSLETARWQIKALMQKTNTTSQAELTRLLMALSNEFVDLSGIARALL